MDIDFDFCSFISGQLMTQARLARTPRRQRRGDGADQTAGSLVVGQARGKRVGKWCLVGE